MGFDDLCINATIDVLKHKESDNLKTFEENNPEVNLPANLNIDAVSKDFPPLANTVISPVNDRIGESHQSWVKIVSKDNEIDNLTKVRNDRSILEHERP